MSFLGVEGCHAFVTGARGGIGSAIVKELLGLSASIPSIPPATVLNIANSCRMQSNGPRPKATAEGHGIQYRGSLPRNRRHIRRILHLIMLPTSRHTLRAHQHPSSERRHYGRIFASEYLGTSAREMGERLPRQHSWDFPYDQAFPALRRKVPERRRDGA